MKRGLNRRALMKTVAAGLAAGASGVLGGRAVEAATDGKPQLKVAGYDYDRVRAIMDPESRIAAVMQRLGLNRHKARQYALQILYQAEASGAAAAEVVEHFWSHGEASGAVREFAERLAVGTVSSLPEVDPLLRESLAHWRLERLGIIDRSVLRMAIFEFLHEPGTPPIVVINEAIELAKRFGGEDSGQFVNGILDAVRKRLETVQPC